MSTLISRKLPRLLKLLSLILILPSLLLNYFLLNKSPGGDIKVIGVIDGDTLVMDGKVRLRLRHIDAPELEFCGGEEAKDLLTKLVDQKKIRVEEKIMDQYGRPMALVYIGDTLVNLKMLESGWARYHSDQTSQTEPIQAVANQAKTDRLGIYSPKCYQKENPDNPKCNIKGNIDKNSTARKYYLPNCAQYAFTIVEKDIGEDWFCTEKDAQVAGFVKAATCH
ncbi:MAG: thermonuclease family protein [Candidatus Beckwithbacteria bacterium]|nr:thermonuclease family protein [Candidatus Beckwithbacteria bacterium]